MMKLLSIQVGLPQMVDLPGKSVRTGIFKSPIDGPVWVGTTNLAGDGQADLTVHGGKDKAVYAFSMDAYRSWELMRENDDLTFGAFGENLTFDRFNEDEIFVGDTFKLGDAILQAAQPRFPCFKLGVKFHDPKAGPAFVKLRRPGIYFRVLQEGNIEKGQSLTPLERAPDEVSIARLFEIVLGADTSEEEIRAILKVKALPDSLRGLLSKF